MTTHFSFLQCPCLENPMVRGTWQATVHRVTKSWTWTQLKWLSTQHSYAPEDLYSKRIAGQLRKEAGSPTICGKRPHMWAFTNYTHTYTHTQRERERERDSLEVKRGVMLSDANYPQASFVESILAKRCVHTWVDPEIYQLWTLNQQIKMTGQGKPGRNSPWM